MNLPSVINTFKLIELTSHVERSITIFWKKQTKLTVSQVTPFQISANKLQSRGRVTRRQGQSQHLLSCETPPVSLYLLQKRRIPRENGNSCQYVNSSDMKQSFCR
ncbi:hypothetical protein NPIL_135801 [Nephila pilipes]|uniref:Uncharacterized protein n=1 Tax=Nephila pilipes TaxID=299642 RepID=A0A8X6Q9W3_NEPPI|nr:hypothetical protein NPIL_135801 [Nephila pilipes]